jgi:hypothetical protein
VKTHISRRIEFTSDDIKEMIIERLEAQDRPYPRDSAVTISFKLTEDGAELAWQEVQ